VRVEHWPISGLISRMCTASESPGSAPSIQMGPVCGLPIGSFVLSRRSSFVRICPLKASSLSTTIVSPDLIRNRGSLWRLYS
jgi:hypothetical protein